MKPICSARGAATAAVLFGTVVVGAAGWSARPPIRAPGPIRLLEQMVDDPQSLRFDAPPTAVGAEVLRSWSFARGPAGWLTLDEAGRSAAKVPRPADWLPVAPAAEGDAEPALRFKSARGGLAIAVPMAAQKLLRVVAKVRRGPLAADVAAMTSERAQVRLYFQATLRELDLPHELAERSYLDVAAAPDVAIAPELLVGTSSAPADGQFHELAATLVTPPGTRSLTLLFAAGDGSTPTAVDLASVRIEELPLRALLPFATEPDPASESAATALAIAALPELGILPAPEPWLPMVRRVEHLLEERLALLLPSPAEASLEVELPAGDWIFEYGVARLHESRRSFARIEQRVALAVTLPDGKVHEQETKLAAGADAHGFTDRTLAFRSTRSGTVRFVFRSTTPRPSPDLVAIGAPLVRPRGARADRRNVVLVSLDTVRADHLSVNGYPRPTTPNLDAFARSSAWFRNASSTSSYTLPAHASLLTGQLPTRHGAHSEAPGRNHIRADRSDLLAEQLRDAGWLTAAFTGGVYLRAGFGFARGFDRYDCTDLALPLDTPRARDLPRAGDAEFNARYRRSRTWSHGLEWIHAHADAPFFLFLHTYVAHEYVAAPEHEARFLGSCDSALARGDLKFIRDRTLQQTPTPADLQRYVDAYDATLREADARVGELLEALRHAGIEEETIVIVCSDHGEEFLDHGGVNHGRTLWEEMVRVPFLIRLPGAAPREIDTPVSLLDLAPTLVELLGLATRHPSDGRSLLPLLRGGTLPAVPLAAELELVPENRWQLRRCGDQVALEVRDERSSRTITASQRPRAAPRRMVHDTARDPRQTRDQLEGGDADEESAAAELQDALEQQREAARERRQAARSAGGEPTSAGSRYDVRAIGGYTEVGSEDDQDDDG